jgi:hypothetical protein
MTGRWIGRGGPIAWPPRSPDLTPLDIFLWGYVKNTVYQVKINDQHMKACIRDAMVTVKHNRSLKVAVQGPDFMAHPLYIHTYMVTVTPNMLQATRGTRLNIVWIFVMPPRELTLKFIEKVIYSEKL